MILTVKKVVVNTPEEPFHPYQLSIELARLARTSGYRVETQYKGDRWIAEPGGATVTIIDGGSD